MFSEVPDDDGGSDGEGSHREIKEEGERCGHGELGAVDEEAEVSDEYRVDEIGKIGMASKKR